MLNLVQHLTILTLLFQFPMECQYEKFCIELALKVVKIILGYR